TGSTGTFRVPGIERNGFSQPKTNVLDLRLSKRFTLREGIKLELLGESFNILNHQNVTGVNATAYTLGNTTVANVAQTNTLTFNTSPANPALPQFGSTTATN